MQADACIEFGVQKHPEPVVSPGVINLNNIHEAEVVSVATKEADVIAVRFPRATRYDIAVGVGREHCEATRRALQAGPKAQTRKPWIGSGETVCGGCTRLPSRPGTVGRFGEA